MLDDCLTKMCLDGGLKEMEEWGCDLGTLGAGHFLFEPHS